MPVILISCIAFLFSIQVIYSQVSYQKDIEFIDKELLDEEFIIRNNIRSIEVTAYQISRNGYKMDRGIREYYEFAEDGKLLKKVEIKNNDTSRVKQNVYTDQGLLKCTLEEDNDWQKRYKFGYRFNGDRSIFQEEDYEMISNDEQILLATKQYFYHDDGRKKMIQFLEEDKVIKTQYFEYDEDKNLIKEKVEMLDGELLEETSYNYDDKRLIHIVQKGMNPGEYEYIYDESGNLIELVYKESSEVMSRTLYKYDESGMIAKVEKQTHSAKRKHIMKNYAYQFRD